VRPKEPTEEVGYRACDEPCDVVTLSLVDDSSWLDDICGSGVTLLAATVGCALSAWVMGVTFPPAADDTAALDAVGVTLLADSGCLWFMSDDNSSIGIPSMWLSSPTR
jgi:hypothetical protein